MKSRNFIYLIAAIAVGVATLWSVVLYLSPSQKEPADPGSGQPERKAEIILRLGPLQWYALAGAFAEGRAIWRKKAAHHSMSAVSDGTQEISRPKLPPIAVVRAHGFRMHGKLV